MFLVMLGPPGAGKGTQAQRIAASEGLVHISTGDMFRENVREGTELGLLAKTYMDQGNLVPDDVTIRMLQERVSRDDAGQGAIFDGFPRNVVQAQALDEALTAQGGAIDRALLITVPDDELVSRLSGRWICRSCGTLFHERFDPPKQEGVCDKCGGELYQRDDDKPDVVRNRLQTQKPSEDLIAYYREKGVLREIDGLQSLEAVNAALLEAMR